MNRKTALLVPAIALLQASIARADLHDSNDELIRHLLTTDAVLTRVAGECSNRRVERSTADGLARFTLTMNCPAPPPEDDCPSYRVTAQGTVDTPTWATVRDLRMELLCSDGPGTQAEIGDAFSGPFDVVTALTLVYGRVPWNPAWLTRFNTGVNGRDFIEARFDQAFVEDGVEKHVVIATLTPQPRSHHSCSACAPMLGGAVFRRDGELWRLEALGRELEQGNVGRDSTRGGLDLVRVGPERFGVLLRKDGVAQGYESRRASLFLGLNGVLAIPFTAGIKESAGPGACPVPAVGLDVTIASGEPPSAAGFYDLIVDAAWNEAQCRSVEVDGGPGISASGESCRRRTRYRFEEGEYRPIDAEVDVCVPIPERAVSLRG